MCVEGWFCKIQAHVYYKEPLPAVHWYQLFMLKFSVVQKFKTTAPTTKRKQWTETQMIKAIEAVKSRKSGVNRAARDHGIQATTDAEGQVKW